MRVILVNGSPHVNGCTNLALNEVAKALNDHGIATEIFHIGTAPVHGCTGCGACRNLGRCVFDDDIANKLAEHMSEADGIVIGSPVYFAAPNGALCALLDRVFFSHSFSYKPAAAVVSCRRGGASAAFDRLNKYFTIQKMPVVSSQYWNSIHGNTAEEASQDLEGLQTMRTLGHNMAYMLESLHKAGLERPEAEERQRTNFIR